MLGTLRLWALESMHNLHSHAALSGTQPSTAVEEDSPAASGTACTGEITALAELCPGVGLAVLTKGGTLLQDAAQLLLYRASLQPSLAIAVCL